MLDKNLIKKKLAKTFNHKVEILEKKNIINGGRKEEILTPFLNPWSNTKELYGKELYEAINIGYSETLIFEIRYAKKVREMKKPDADGNKRRFLVKYDDLRYEVYEIDFRNDSKDTVLIKTNRVS